MANAKEDIVKTMEQQFKKLPSLPANIRDVLVKIAPWMVLIFGILGIIGGITVFGLSPVAALGGVKVGMNVMISAVLTIVYSVMFLIAFPKLRKHQLSGWTILFWAEVLSLVSSLTAGVIIRAIIGALIGFYLLFQIKSHYK